MGESMTVAERLRALADRLVDGALEHLPGLLGAVVLLVAGWILAKVLRALSHRLMGWLDRMLTRLLGEGRASRVRLGRSAEVLGNIVFWAVVLFFITAATQVLGLTFFSSWLAAVVEHLPMVLAGVLIVAAGWLLSRFVADLILGASRLPHAQRLAAARVAQAAILAGALLVGADQIGIRVTFLAIFLGGLAVAVAGGAIVAISVGARQHVANLIGVLQVRQSLERGQSVRIGDIEGRVLEISSHGVLLEAQEGRITVPGHLFAEQPFVLLAPEAEGTGDD